MALVYLAPEMTEEQTFEDLAAPHMEELRQLAIKLSDSGDEAEELFQETVAAGVAAFPGLRRRELLGAWLQQICRRKRIDVLRRRYRDRKLRDLPQLEVMERSGSVDMELVHRVLALWVTSRGGAGEGESAASPA